jgi:hypothetical protein
MVAPLTTQRNTERAQCKGRAGEGCPKSAAKGIIEAGARKPRPSWVRRSGRDGGGKPRPDDGLLNLALWPLDVVNGR